MIIRAGVFQEIAPSDSTWCFLDIGFSAKKKSCGLLIGAEEPQEVLFSQAKSLIADLAQESKKPVNLVIEAPLSVSFDCHGNPAGRAIEKRGPKTRYWYTGLGCVVMVAATYLVRHLADESCSNEIRLFEGFVSFKDRNVPSDHSLDVMRLRDAVNGIGEYRYATEDELRMTEADQLRSAFSVIGLDLGIPPVILCE